MRELAAAKQEYDKLASALSDAKENGYGIVTPQVDEMILEEPEIIKNGNRFGVRLKASAPSLHIIRTDVEAEIAPILGLSDVIVDIVETGTTLKENDLVVRETIVPISARLIANKASFKFKSEQIEKIASSIRMQVQAEANK